MRKTDLRQFDYQKVAQLDCRIWQAYYAHNFFKMFYLTIKLLKTQLGLNLFLTLKLAYDFSLASAEYRLNKNHLKSDRALKHLTKFYRTISKHSSEPYDYKKAAQAELDWWNIQRYEPKNQKGLALGLAKVFAIVYKTSPQELLPYGQYRTEALALKNKYMHQQKVAVEWPEIEKLLIKSWQSLYKAIQK